ADVVESDIATTVLEYGLSSIIKDAIDINGEIYYSIAVGEESKTTELGFPAVPNVCRSIIIPDDAEMAVRVISSHYVEYEGVPVAPSKGIITRDVDPASVPYVFDGFYDTDEWYPSRLVTLRDPYVMRDFRGTVVELNPIQYNPSTQTLRVYDSVVVEVASVGAAKQNALTQRPAFMDREFRNIYARHFLNFADAPLDRYPAVDDGGNMLVICYDDAGFLAEMQPLVEWKNQMGVPCEMVTVTDAGGTASGIDSYIETYYNTNGLTYVLLVGDAAQCPSLTVSDLSDPSYGLISVGDSYADLFIGRFSAENTGDLATQVLRTIEYEKRPQAGAEWYHKGMGVASNQGPGDDGEYDNEHEDVIRLDLLAFTYTEVDQIYDPTGTAAMVTTALEDGRSIINYTGHGSETSWGSTGFSNSHIDALTNDNMLPFGMSVACENGNFSGTCFGEAWLRATNGSNGEPTGAIGFYASTISQSWDPPMDAQDEIVDLLVGTSAEGIRRTYGGICFNGCGHMIDDYGSAGENEYYHWTIFGDPSLRVRTDTPAALVVNHLPVIYPSMTTWDVEVFAGGSPVDEALCCLYYDGTIYGSGTTDATGNVSMNITTMVPVGEMLTLTVTGFNTETYTADVQAIVPVTYTIVPSSIPISTPTDVTVTILDDGGLPLPDVELAVDGWSFTTVEGTTDINGEVTLSLESEYGQDLTIVGSEIGESYNCLEDVIPVTGGVDFATQDIDAAVASIGLYGALAPFIEGTVTFTNSEMYYNISLLGCGINMSAYVGATAVYVADVTPTSAGIVEAVMGKAGFNIYSEDITVQVVYGQLAGEVYEAPARAPIEGAIIKGYATGADTTGAVPIFTATSGAGGVYAVEGDLEVNHYDVYVLKFGYITLFEDVFVQYGANDVDFFMEFAPSGVVSGTVTEAGTGTPLDATVKFYRSDTMELYAETTTDPVTGDYSQSLPYFNYTMNVRAYHHIPATLGITVDGPTEVFDFQLEETLANILLIDDENGKREFVKYDKSGAVIDIEAGGDRVKSASEIEADLVDLGYDVTVETSAASDPLTWMNYDFIISSSGDDTAPVEDAGYRADLESYVAGGGKLLVEGGEVVYDAVSYPGYPTFAANVLHSDSWQHDSSGTGITVYDASHPITTFPNTIGTISVSYVGYGDHDSHIPSADADIVMSWSGYSTLSSVQVYDDTPDPSSGQIVLYSFNYAAAEAAGRKGLLENTVVYLITPESTPTGGLSGVVTLEGEIDHIGILVTASPGGASAYTNKAGEYSISEMYAGTYTVTATKTDWSTGVVEGVVVTEGMVTPGVDMVLTATTTYEYCETPSLSIPDSSPTGVYDYLTFPDDVVITEIELYVNITHTYIGDLIVAVTSPEGTTVRLHDRSGGSASNIVGWYPTELTVDGPGSLDDQIGENAQGEWTIWVSDNAGADTGVLNTWCVRVVGGVSTGVEEMDVPRAYELAGVSPNPFNPMTTVTYGMPTSGHIELAVYNVAGQLVKTLVNGDETAGWHAVTWDGRDDNGGRVASGVYFARMQADEFTGSTKMVLLK
nr:proprotein convertase P-domain-containing protein [bacterium]